MCRICTEKPARTGDTRCHRCASPSRYGANGKMRAAQSRRYRAACKDRLDRGICEFCGNDVGGINLQVDHANGTHSDDRPENWQVLCVPCHTMKTRLNGEYCKRSNA